MDESGHKICFNEEQLRFITRLNFAGVTTRYPDDLAQAIKEYPEDLAREYVQNTKDVILCIKKQII